MEDEARNDGGTGRRPWQSMWSLEKLHGEGYPNATISSSRAILNDRKWFRAGEGRDTIQTADSVFCRLEDGEPVVYLGGVGTNMVLRDVDGYKIKTSGRNGEYFIPSKAETLKIVESCAMGDTHRFSYSELELEDYPGIGPYAGLFYHGSSGFSFRTKFPGRIKVVKGQWEVAQILFGEEDRFEGNMEALYKAGIEEVGFSILDPTTLQKRTYNAGEGISRPSHLHSKYRSGPAVGFSAVLGDPRCTKIFDLGGEDD